MLCVQWDVYGVVYWELLPSNTTKTAKVYCNQIQKMRTEFLIIMAQKTFFKSKVEF